MDKQRFSHLIEIVGEAMERGSGARDAFLLSACADDSRLLEEARSMVAEAQATSLADVTGRLEAAVERAAAWTIDDEAGHPSRIGPYRIVRRLGRGGMGVVYLARQDEPIRRDVAIKVIRGAVLDRDTIARFAAERQALALMEHPGIARIFDAGTTDDGLPYFVMELVEGPPITEYCQQNALSLDERLKLFRHVCRAVHHAHQRGVIHRDLKPSNVLIVTGDGGPVPKVIDFGVAKATEALLSDESFHTRAGSLVGTLDYMSPEQIRGEPGEIDVRADVYSLGVILYELVTGRHPFADTVLRRAGLLEAQRIILESDPPRPTWTGADSAREGDGAEPGWSGRRAPRRRIRRDLGWIVMKALEKDKERRYASALDFARDLEAYARDEPVSAGPPSLTYRAQKFVRRHRVGVAAAAMIALALVAGTVLAGVGFVRATAEARRAQAISGFLTDMLASVRPDMEGRAVTVREVLDEARARLEEGEFSDDPETEASVALVMGHSYEGLGLFDEAITLLQHSVDLRRDLYGPGDRRLYDSMYRLGTALWKRGDLEEALALRLEIAEMTERLFGTSHPEHAESLSNLGNTHADMGDLERAAQYQREAVQVGRRLPGDEGQLDLARFLNNLGTVQFDLGNFDSAEGLFQESLEIRGRLRGEHDDVYAITLMNLGNTRQRLDELEDAESLLRRAVDLEEDIYGRSHPRTASAYSALAMTLSRQGHYGTAEELLRKALAIRIATSGDNAWRVASERRKLAELLMDTGRPDEALLELRTAWEELVATGEESTESGRDVARSMERLHAQLGNTELAATWAVRVEAMGG